MESKCECNQKVEEMQIEINNLRKEVDDLKKLFVKKTKSSKIKPEEVPENFTTQIIFSKTNVDWKPTLKPLGLKYGIKIHYDTKKHRLRVSRKFNDKYMRVSFYLPKYYHMYEDGEDVVQKISQFIKDGAFNDLTSTSYKIVETISGDIRICYNDDEDRTAFS